MPVRLVGPDRLLIKKAQSDSKFLTAGLKFYEGSAMVATKAQS